MSSSKARSLRERMSIDPDAPEPVSRPRRQRAAPPPEPVPSRDEVPATVEQPAAPDPPTPEPAAPEPGDELGPSSPPPRGPSATEKMADSRSAAAQPSATPEHAPLAAVAPATVDTAAGPPARSTSRRSSSGRSTRRKGREDLGWTSALDDPSVSSGGNGYRSFYVSDEVFARFRAAVYWTARRPDATDVPDNMSAGIEDYMDQVASELERRFNGKDVFPPTPDQLKAHRRRENGTGRQADRS